MMALLALMVFGAIGILLTTTVILEHSVRVRAAKRNAAHPCDNRCDFRRRKLPTPEASINRAVAARNPPAKENFHGYCSR
jgi:hypothetical protein